MAQIHGGDWAGRNRTRLDFSASISPLPMPASAFAAIRNSLLHADRYPDPQCRALKQSLACHFSLQESQILCGSGAADLIYRLAYALRPKKALILAPTFNEYRAALSQTGCQIDEYRLRPETGFSIEEDILERLSPKLDLLILCEPNNPTGIVTDWALLYRILERCSLCGICLMVDESFHGFLDPDIYPSMLKYLRSEREGSELEDMLLSDPQNQELSVPEDMPLSGQQNQGLSMVEDMPFSDPQNQRLSVTKNMSLSGQQNQGLSVLENNSHPVLKNSSLLVLRSFTKLYAMAGIRLGWCACSNLDLIEKMEEAGPPWSVSAPAQAGGIACLEDSEYPAAVRTMISREKKILADALTAAGCTVIQGAANYLLFYDMDAKLSHKLGEEGIWIRDCSDFSGLGPGWYRTAVKTADENEQLIQAIIKAHAV